MDTIYLDTCIVSGIAKQDVKDSELDSLVCGAVAGLVAGLGSDQDNCLKYLSNATKTALF